MTCEQPTSSQKVISAAVSDYEAVTGQQGGEEEIEG